MEYICFNGIGLQMLPELIVLSNYILGPGDLGPNEERGLFKEP